MGTVYTVDASGNVTAAGKVKSASSQVTNFTIAGVIHNDTSGNLSTSNIVNADVDSAANITLSKINTSTLGTGYFEISNGLTTTLTNPMPTFINVSNAGAGININLPNMTQSNALQSSLLDVFYIKNNDSSQQVSVFDNSSTLVVTIYPGQIYAFAVKSNATAAGVFIAVNLTNIASVSSPLSLSSHGVLSIPAATTSVDGYLSHTDWTTFNNKQSTITTANVDTGSANATGMNLIGAQLSLTSATGSQPGVLTASTQTIGGNKTFTGTISASNLGNTNWGDFTANAIDGGAPNSTGMNITAGNSSTPQSVSLNSATGSQPGLVNATTQTFGGNKTFTGTISASNLSNTNTGDISLNSFGSTPNSSGLSLSAQALTMQPADGSNPGGVSTGTQTFAGNKTFTGTISSSNLSGTNHGDMTVNNIDGGPSSPTGMNVTSGNSSTPQAISLNSASPGGPGLVNTATQSFGGTKTFNNPVGVGGSPNASSVLDCTSTTLGFGLPAMTTTQKNAISSPKAGLMVFDSTLSKACVYSGSAWQTITSV